MTGMASKDQTDTYKSRSWVPKFPNGGWVFIGMAVAFLALVLFYGAIHSIQDLGATLLILIILAVVGLWSVLRHINASITSGGIALNENLLNYRMTIRFEDISDVFPYTGSYAPKPSIYCFADRQKDWANRVVCIYMGTDDPIFVNVNNAEEFVAMFEAMRAAYGPVVPSPPVTSPPDGE